MNAPLRFAAAVLGVAVLLSAAAPAASADPGLTPEDRDGVAARGQDSGQVIVHYVRDAAEAVEDRAVAEAEERLGAELTPGADVAAGGQVVQVEGADVDAAAAELARQPGVAGAEPNRRMFAAAPNDPLLPEQWDLAKSRAGADAAGAWKLSSGSGARVAVIDSGSTAHPDLAGRYVGGYDFISDAPYARDKSGRDANPLDQGDWLTGTKADLECYNPNDPTPVSSSWHGTHVAGAIVAGRNNNRGIAGLAPAAKVVPIRVLGLCGGLESDIADAIVWASGGRVPGVPKNAHPAKVVNLSLGIEGRCSRTMQGAVRTAIANGSVVIAAAGNEHANVANFAPANCPGAIAVGAVDRHARPAPYSNYGKAITLMAQGGDLASGRWQDGIVSTVNQGVKAPTSGTGYAAYDGTSMAAPHVSAVAALALGMNPYLSPRQLRNLLLAGTEALPVACPQGCGAGISDAAKTLHQHPRISKLSPASGPLKGGTKVTVSGSGLRGATKVTFGGRPGTKVSYSASTQRLTVLAPRGAKKATVTVKVYTDRGNSRPSSASGYRYR